MGAFTTKMGIPAPFAFLAIMAEFLGGLGLIVGFLSRIAAFGIFCNMLVAVMMIHRHVGFFMNWYGNQAGEGFEYHLLAMAIALVIIINGAGAFPSTELFRNRKGRVSRRDRAALESGQT